MLDRLAKNDDQLITIDLNPFVYSSSSDIGSLRNFKNIFQEDGLHLTDEGYVQLAAYLAQILQKELTFP
jgi:lysophospholipase L1-like esterase